jgi:hypothetical protein
MTRRGAVVRSDDPSRLTAGGRAAVVAYGVRLIVDLRTPDEITEFPNPFAAPGPHGVVYRHLPFNPPDRAPAPPLDRLADEYTSMLDRSRTRVAAILRDIADAPPGCVLIHCVAGKDRTGLVAALLLELAGVPRDLVAEDYALTTEFLRARDEEWLARGPGSRREREEQYARYHARADVMREALAYLDATYGGPEAYLLGGGLTPDEITRLRARLVGRETDSPEGT